MADELAERPMFDEWLRRHARGTLNDEATAALAEVVESVSVIGKAGRISIDIAIEPAGSGGRTVAIGGRVKVSKPAPAPELGVFYVGIRGSLHRDDPLVQRLPGVPYADSAGEIKVVDQITGEVRRVEETKTPRIIEGDQQ